MHYSATENGTQATVACFRSCRGQRLSRCTCSGESHPGPRPRRRFVRRQECAGNRRLRGADHRRPIDGPGLSECAMGAVRRVVRFPLLNVTRSSVIDVIWRCRYTWLNTSDNLIIPDTTLTVLNPYKGGVFQQATSGVTEVNQKLLSTRIRLL